MVALTALKPGDRLWESRTVKQGNTNLTKVVHYPVTIVEVRERYATGHWNGNAEPERFDERRLNRMRRTKPGKA